MFAAPHVLSINSNYRLVLKPGASDIKNDEWVVDSASILDAWEGGSKMHLTTRVDAGSWTETTTTRPDMGLIIDQFDDGVGGGSASGVRNPFGGPIG